MWIRISNFGVNFCFQLLELSVFWNWNFRVHILLMILLTNFFYLEIYVYVTFRFWDGTSSFCSTTFRVGSLLWEYLRDWCWRVFFAVIFWRSGKSWWMMLSLRFISVSRFSTWILLFSCEMVINCSFFIKSSQLLLKEHVNISFTL